MCYCRQSAARTLASVYLGSECILNDALRPSGGQEGTSSEQAGCCVGCSQPRDVSDTSCLELELKLELKLGTTAGCGCAAAVDACGFQEDPNLLEDLRCCGRVKGRRSKRTTAWSKQVVDGSWLASVRT